jgi:aryl-alcohol dehydrogenase-like predicted oxidoreductase
LARARGAATILGMRTRTLGTLTTSAIGYGAMALVDGMYGAADEARSLATLRHALDAGCTLLDTADAYGGGGSETTIGEWLRTKPPSTREGIVLSTKTFNPMEAGADHGLRPERIRRQLESSLGRLGVERVDMYLTHEQDPETPIEDTLGALDELVRAGKVGAVGASNVDGAGLAEALDTSARRGLVSFEWVQNSYSLLERGAEQDVLPLCAEHGLGFTPFSPLAGGWLTGKYRADEPPPPGSRMTQRPEAYRHLETPATYRSLARLREHASARRVDTATLAIAWLLAHPLVTAVVVGPRRPAHLEPARRALDLDLSGSDAAEIAALFPTD